MYLIIYLTLSLDVSGCSAPRPGRFNPEKEPVTIVWEIGSAQRTVWAGAKDIAFTGIRSPDRPAHSESLH